MAKSTFFLFIISTFLAAGECSSTPVYPVHENTDEQGVCSPDVSPSRNYHAGLVDDFRKYFSDHHDSAKGCYRHSNNLRDFSSNEDDDSNRLVYSLFACNMPPGCGSCVLDLIDHVVNGYVNGSAGATVYTNPCCFRFETYDIIYS